MKLLDDSICIRCNYQKQENILKYTFENNYQFNVNKMKFLPVFIYSPTKYLTANFIKYSKIKHSYELMFRQFCV